MGRGTDAAGSDCISAAGGALDGTCAAREQV